MPDMLRFPSPSLMVCSRVFAYTVSLATMPVLFFLAYPSTWQKRNLPLLISTATILALALATAKAIKNGISSTHTTKAGFFSITLLLAAQVVWWGMGTLTTSLPIGIRLFDAPKPLYDATLLMTVSSSALLTLSFFLMILWRTAERQQKKTTRGRMPGFVCLGVALLACAQSLPSYFRLFDIYLIHHALVRTNECERHLNLPRDTCRTLISGSLRLSFTYAKLEILNEEYRDFNSRYMQCKQSIEHIEKSIEKIKRGDRIWRTGPNGTDSLEDSILITEQFRAEKLCTSFSNIDPSTIAHQIEKRSRLSISLAQAGIPNLAWRAGIIGTEAEWIGYLDECSQLRDGWRAALDRLVRDAREARNARYEGRTPDFQ